MTATHFSGPVVSAAGFVVGSSDSTSGAYGGGGTSASPISLGTTANQNAYANYFKTLATTGDTRLSYNKLTFAGVGGSGETLRAFSVVDNVSVATGGTVNGAHISLEINGASGAVAGAGNALRVTLGGTATTPGGTLAAIQLDSNFDAGATVPTSSAFLRVTDTNTNKIPNLLNLPAPSAGTIFRAQTAAAVTHVIKIIASNGTSYYIMVSTNP